MTWYRISKLWFGNGHPAPVCGKVLRMSSRFGHPGGGLNNLRQTPKNSLLVSVAGRCCAQKQLTRISLPHPSNSYGKVSDQILCQSKADIDVGRRYHHNVDKHKLVHHFKQRSYYLKIRNSLVAALASFSTLAAATGYLSHPEEIPYSKRTHLVLVPRQAERVLADNRIDEFKKEHEGKILAATHPITTRLTIITEKVLEALERGLRDHNNWGGPNYGSRWMEAFKALWQGKELIHPNAQTHFDQVNRLQVLVVDDPRKINAYYYCNGTIVVCTGILDLFESDAEMATIIGHEVADGVARHSSEMITHCLGLDILGLFWGNVDISALSQKLYTLQKNRSLSVKQELEADYMGMLLMASAGYDPRAALFVYQKLGEVVDQKLGQVVEHGSEDDDDLDEDDDDDDLEEDDDLTINTPKTKLSATHPSGERRVECLTQALEEAMALYRKSITYFTGSGSCTGEAGEGTSKIQLTTSTDHSFKPECTK